MSTFATPSTPTMVPSSSPMCNWSLVSFTLTNSNSAIKWNFIETLSHGYSSSICRFLLQTAIVLAIAAMSTASKFTQKSETFAMNILQEFNHEYTRR